MKQAMVAEHARVSYRVGLSVSHLGFTMRKDYLYLVNRGLVYYEVDRVALWVMVGLWGNGEEGVLGRCAEAAT